MAGCCGPDRTGRGASGAGGRESRNERSGCARIFDARQARKDAAAYRRKGLDPTARRLVDVLRGRLSTAQSLLEVGGGVGAIQLELLRAWPAARSLNVELSPAYEDAARELLAEVSLNERVQRRVSDFAREAQAVPPADVVVMHRVVCCYPDMAALVTAAADRALRYLAMTFPRETWWMRLGMAAANVWYRLTAPGFRVYVHPPAAIVATAEARGLRTVFEGRGAIWQTAVLERSPLS